MTEDPACGAGGRFGAWGFRALVAALFVAAGAVQGAGESNTAPAPDVVDLGVVDLYGVVTNDFTLENTSPEDRAIVSVKPSCECVRILSYPEHLAAGEKGRVTFAFVPGGAGPVRVDVVVEADGGGPARELWSIQADVRRAQGRDKSAELPDVRPDVLARKIRSQDDSCYEPVAGVLTGDESSAWTLVDIRDADSFNRIHPARALNMPLFAVKTASFLRGRKVLLVDQGFGSVALEDECRRLKALGFEEARILAGGLNRWIRSGGAVEGTAVESSDPSALLPAQLFEARQLDRCVVILADVARSDLAHAVLPEGADLPFVQGDTTYGSRVQAMLGEATPRPLLVVVTEEGRNDASIVDALRGVDADVFHLRGGARAYHEYLATLSQSWQGGHTETVVSSGTAGPGTSGAKPCGSCPR